MAVKKRKKSRFEFLTRKFPLRMQRKLVMLFMAVVLAFVVLIGRITYINVTKGSKYTKVVLDQQNYDSRVIAFKRGDIVDRNGTKMATSERVYNVILDVAVMMDKKEYIEPTKEVLKEGTPERAAFYHDMDVIAEILRRFQEERIPILWRPFHESYGTWFWWGAQGPEVVRNLYHLMFDYYTGEKDLHNLLWVWNSDVPEAYPGDSYVDVVSMDVYLPEYLPTDYAETYKKLVTATSRNKITALAEIGYLPDIELLQKSRIPWAYYMTWSKEFCIGEKYNSVEKLKKMYDSEYAVTL
jgi:beta-mannanase